MNKRMLALAVKDFDLVVKKFGEVNASQQAELWKIFQKNFLDSSLLDMVEVEWTQERRLHRGVINTSRSKIHTVGMSVFGFYWSTELVGDHWKMCRGDLALLEFSALRNHFQIRERNIHLIHGKHEMILHTDGKRLAVAKIDA